jgi:hypothetical protein
MLSKEIASGEPSLGEAEGQAGDGSSPRQQIAPVRLGQTGLGFSSRGQQLPGRRRFLDLLMRVLFAS